MAGALTLALGAAGCGKAPAPEAPEVARPVRTVALQQESAELERRYSARVSAGEQAELSFRRAGTLAEVAVRAGDRVEAGQLLARLDPRDFETALAETRSAYDSEFARLELLRAGARTEDIAAIGATLSAARAQERNAAIDFERKKRMLERGLIPQSDFDRAITARDVTRADVERVSQELAKAQAGARPEEIAAQASRVESLRARVEQAEAALGDTALTAPFGGLVALVLADNFVEVQAKQPVVTVQDVSGVRVTLNVPESFIRHAERGRAGQFEVRFPGEGQTAYPASFREISAEADPQTQTYAVVLDMPAPAGINVLSGMSAEVTVRLPPAAGEAAGRLMAPVQAVAGGEGGARYLWSVDGASQRLVRLAVETGDLSGDRIAIVSGAAAGQRVVTAGLSALREGMLVRPIEP